MEIKIFNFKFIFHTFFATFNLSHTHIQIQNNHNNNFLTNGERNAHFLYIFQLIPLVVVIGAGAVLAAGISVRLLTQSPDVTLARKSNPEPWEKYRNKQYKVSKQRYTTKYKKKQQPQTLIAFLSSLSSASSCTHQT